MSETKDFGAVIPAHGYAGDIPPALAWQWVQAGNAVLVDVRTDAERAWVGQSARGQSGSLETMAANADESRF